MYDTYIRNNDTKFLININNINMDLYHSICLYKDVIH